MITRLELELPAHWAAYLINGDKSGYSDTEIAEIEACLERQEVGECIGASGEPFFSSHHDAWCVGTLPADCLVYTFYYSRRHEVESMVTAYLAAAAWSTGGTDLEGNELESLEEYEFSDAAREYARAECGEFIHRAGPLLDDLDAEQVGHDFWLTRERHGVGFRDRELGGIGDRLARLSETFGEGNLYLGDDGLLHFAGEGE